MEINTAVRCLCQQRLSHYRPKIFRGITKRIDYAIETLTEENKNKIHPENLVGPEDITTEMIVFLSAIKNSLFSESNSEILDYLFLHNLS